MTQILLSPAQFDEIAQSVTAWAREVLHQLDLVEHRADQAKREATSALRGRVHMLDQVKVQPPSALAGCLLVRIPTEADSANSPLEALHRHAAATHGADAVRRQSAFLREELVSGLNAVRASHRWMFRRHRNDDLVSAVDRLRSLADWGKKTGFHDDLRALAGEPDPPLELPWDLPRTLAVALDVPAPAAKAPVLPADELALLQRVLARGGDLLETRERLVQRVVRNFDEVRDRMVTRRLKDVPLSAIKDASKGQVRVGSLESAGVTTVQMVLDRGEGIAELPGVGFQTATQVLATARSLRRAVKDDLKVRFDLDEKDALLTSLIASLYLLLDFEARVEKHRDDLNKLVGLLTPLRGVPTGKEDVVLLHRHSPRRGSDLTRYLRERTAWVRASGLDGLLGDARVTDAQGAQVWDDFKRRAQEYHSLLERLVGITVDVDAAQGHLPKEVVDAVHRQNLDTSRLKASLRGYQAFGARYALVQRRVLIGDEMGLGKTVQSLAVMAHLAANGARHFLVVCPTAVLVNWTKEIRKHTHLEPIRVHGPGRDQEWRRWRDRGGVAVTSYQTLLLLQDGGEAPDLLVVDEAHFVKNPLAKRSAAVAELVERSGRTMFLTGTPLENRVEEFEQLVTYLQPDVASRLDAAEMVLGAHKFREAVAPVYLRRNSKDVLSELPDLVVTEEWLEFTDLERDAYVDALSDRAFPKMRRIAFTADPTGSSKLGRLEEIIEEASANGHKVLVFSYFLDVLDAMAHRLGSRVVGTISGATSADGRQQLVDRFTDTSEPGVLLSQIAAGGVGLNLQTASVVILCEPQIKPSLEYQAVKRAHRMGQVRAVQVHRLLTENSVDERMLEILGHKSELFEQYAAQSDVAAASPEAVDRTESSVAQQVLALEQERYAAEIRARLADMPKSNAASGDGPEPAPPPASARPDATNPAGDPVAGTSVPPTSPTPPSAPYREPRSRDFERLVNTCGSCNRPIQPISGLCGCS
jgi:superfamily II DNA or RNA helicase